MITTEQTRSVSATASFKTEDFGIDSEDLQHIIALLRDNIYSDKEKSVLREVCANALDSHTECGKENVPIRVTVPTRFESKLKIRDFGNGLSYEDMKNIYIKYGKSTKRNSNTQVGCFGLGCKIPWAITDSFIVNSFQNGIKSVYTCVLDETNVGRLIVVGNFPSDEPTGLEVVINVPSDSIKMFREKALELFKYWTIKPELVGFEEAELEKFNLPENVLLSGTGWKMVKDNSNDRYSHRISESVAVMGNIAYPIKFENVKGYSEYIEANGGYYLNGFFTGNRFVFDFAIGDVKMSPSRESLEYVDKTNTAIIERLKMVVAEIASIIQAKIDVAGNIWEAKVIFNALVEAGANSMNCLAQSMKLVYNGVPLANSKFTTYSKSYDYSHIVKVYEKKAYNTRFTVRDCSELQARTNTLIIEIDQDKCVYISKACEYLKEKNGQSKFYVLKFVDAAQRTKVMSDVGLEDAFIVKYSTISDAVKATIIRSGPVAGGVVAPKVKNVTAFRDLRVIESSVSWRYNVSDLPSKSVDMSVGGVYIETKNNKIVNCTKDLQTLSDRVEMIRATHPTFELCVIGQNYMGTAVMKLGTWVKFDDYLNEYLTNEVKKNADFRMTVAYIKSGVKEKLDLDSDFVKLVSGSTKDADLKKFLGMDKSANFTRLIAAVGANYTADSNDVKIVTDLYDVITKKFPMIHVCNDAMKAYTTTQSTKDAIVEYLTK